MASVRHRLGLVFWGLLLVFLDFTIDGFDLLPDPLGYLLVAIGCGGLSQLSSRFATARTLAWVMLALSIIAYLVRGDAALLLGIVGLISDCLLIWSLLGGIMEYAQANGRADLAERAANRRVVYVFLLGACQVLVFLPRFDRDLMALLAIIGAITLVVLLMMILHLIHRVRSEIAFDVAR